MKRPLAHAFVVLQHQKLAFGSAAGTRFWSTSFVLLTHDSRFYTRMVGAKRFGAVPSTFGHSSVTTMICAGIDVENIIPPEGQCRISECPMRRMTLFATG